MEFVLPMAATFLITLATVTFASIIAAIPLFRNRKSDILTLPVGSSWLQQKHAFRCNGPKLIEQGFLAVSVLRSLRILTFIVADATLHHQSSTGVFRVVYLNGNSSIKARCQVTEGLLRTRNIPDHHLPTALAVIVHEEGRRGLTCLSRGNVPSPKSSAR
jgi:hypothetical protein